MKHRAAFEAFWIAAPERMRLRSKTKPVTYEFYAKLADKWGPEAIQAAFQAYLARDPDYARTGGPGVHIWLRDKAAHWLEQPTPKPVMALCTQGPAKDVVIILEQVMSREAAVIWLARCKIEGRTITAYPSAYEKLSREQVLAQQGWTVAKALR